jgi:malate dehydrogenase (oxaloacetate-decarboxylating)(NADP+)
MNGLMLPGRQVFLVDTHVNADPSAGELGRDHRDGRRGDVALRRAAQGRLLSHSNFGTSDLPSAQKMRARWRCCATRRPWLEVDGEMHGDVALDGAPAWHDAHSTLHGDANLLVLPNIDAANISYNLLKTAPAAALRSVRVARAAKAGAHPDPVATVRRIVNMSALTVADATRSADGHRRSAAPPIVLRRLHLPRI